MWELSSYKTNKEKKKKKKKNQQVFTELPSS